MNDLEIAPLAQRLAEENNVDWRRLQGSGANGRIVERDVLAYLARVMAGEEAVDPTPEPVPEGMEAWPDASGAGSQARQPEASGASDAWSATTDAPASESGAWATGSAAGGAAVNDLAEDEDLLLAGDDVESADEGDLLAPPEPAATRPVAGDDLPDLFDDEAAPAADEDAAPDLFDGDLTWDADDTPSRPTGERDASAGYDAPGEAGPAADDEDALDFDGFPTVDGPRSTPSEPAEGGRDIGAWSDEAPDRDGPFAGAEPRTGAGAPSGPSWNVDGEVVGEDVGLGPDDGPMAPVADLGGHGPDEGRRDPAGDDGPGIFVSDDPDAAPTVGDEDAPAAAWDGSLGATVAGEAAHAPRGRSEAGVSAAGVGAGADLPLARSRQVLRRHVDFGGALELQRMLASDTGRDDLAVPALLLLAARRAGPLLDVHRPGLVRSVDGEVTATVVEGDALGALTEALAADPEGGDGRADLWVADLSGHGLDDAVLDVDALQLTLGRILSDGDDGRVRATLALAGDVPLDRGATYLARVADLIEEPLRLLI